MSASNYLSSRDKTINRCLPNIIQQKFSYRINQDFSAYSTNHNNLLNRSIDYNFEVPHDAHSLDRASTPISDFYSESETDTPDIRSEESDSSAGSALRQSTAEATHALAAEWECIERTIYGEDGQKVTRPQLLEECRQWQELHPQLRIVGKAIPLPENRPCYRHIEHEEIIAIHYSDYEQFSESEERLSQSSADVTPQNSPRPSVAEGLHEPLLYREKYTTSSTQEGNLPDAFCSLLQITPIHIRSPSVRKRQNSSILKSELSSSKWMRNSRPDSSKNCDRNSAKSFISLDTRKYHSIVMSANERNKTISRIYTAKHRDNAKLEPLYTPELVQNDARFSYGLNSSYTGTRKVSLPPLLLEEEKQKINSGKKQRANVNVGPKPKKNKKFYPLSECGTRKDRHVWNN